ncbi:MAG: hypothetical protein ACR2ON_00300, partial [Paracoccaceae bacterium]
DSLDTRVSTEEVAQSNAKDSLDTRVSTEEVAQSNAKDSLDTRISSEERTTQVATLDIASGVESVEIDFENDLGMVAPFVNTPAVAGTMRNTSADAEIIIPMLAGTSSKTGCKFVFSDEIAGTNYKLDIIVTD